MKQDLVLERPADDLFDLDLQVAPVSAGTTMRDPATSWFTCDDHTCLYSCTLTCTGATGRPCAC